VTGVAPAAPNVQYTPRGQDLNQLKNEGYNDFYANLAADDREDAQRDRDVTRADTLRQAREGAIAGGIDPGGRQYAAMMANANADANIHALQSREDSATRAQDLMLQQREESERNIEQQLESMDKTQQAAYFKALNEGMSPGDAMGSLYNPDGTAKVKAPSAAEQAVQEEAEQLMLYYPEQYPDVESATAAATKKLREAKELTDKEITADVKAAERGPALLENIVEGNNVGAKGWKESDFQTAIDEGFLGELNIQNRSGVTLNQIPGNFGSSISKNENVWINGEIYRIDSYTPATQDSDFWGGRYWTGGDAALTKMTNFTNTQAPGTSTTWDKAQNTGG
jgi:hypothetical protein